MYTVATMKLMNGQTIEMSLTFTQLRELAEKYPAIYKKYNEIVMKGMRDMLDYVDAIYAAYCCRCLAKKEEPMPEKDFLENMPFDMDCLVEKYSALYNAQKKINSEKFSEEKPEA